MASSHGANADQPCRVLVLVAHPDDAEVGAGGLIVRHCRLGSVVRIVSVTDGRSGHYSLSPEVLADIRRREARAAGERVGAEYVTWEYPDGELEASLEVRRAIIREIRAFAPDLVLTHRANDYHPDHRAVGISVQNASYMVTVPNICPDVAALRRDPVVASMVDLFTRPSPMRPDVILDVVEEFDLAVQMAACHESQFFQWLPYHDGCLHAVPNELGERFEWLADRFQELHRRRQEHFADALVAAGLRLEDGAAVELFEISEYARQPGSEELAWLFPGWLSARRA
jgi:N-acetylglucosamine malate deacetylase 1